MITQLCTMFMHACCLQLFPKNSCNTIRKYHDFAPLILKTMLNLVGGTSISHHVIDNITAGRPVLSPEKCSTAGEEQCSPPSQALRGRTVLHTACVQLQGKNSAPPPPPPALRGRTVLPTACVQLQGKNSAPPPALRGRTSLPTACVQLEGKKSALHYHSLSTLHRGGHYLVLTVIGLLESNGCPS